jgi:hypothetical protein
MSAAAAARGSDGTNPPSGNGPRPHTRVVSFELPEHQATR